MISRRGFFGAIAAATVGLAAKFHIPDAFIPDKIKTLRYRGATVGGIDQASFKFWRNDDLHGEFVFKVRTLDKLRMDSPKRLGVLTNIE
jgi:hypothetical protein